MPRHPDKEPKLCKNGDGNKHYAKGYCAKCYMASYRVGGDDVAPEAENLEDVAPQPLQADALDTMQKDTIARVPSTILATVEQAGDTDGIRTMRQRLANAAYLARREVVKTMLFDGLEDWQIKNEFLVRADLFKQFVKVLKDPDRILDADILSIMKSGRLRPLERYIEGLKRGLRRANSFADDAGLNAKERSAWAKTADDLLRNIAIQEKAIHPVPGKGDMPIGDSFDDLDDEDEAEGQFLGYSLPPVDEGKPHESYEVKDDQNN